MALFNMPVKKALIPTNNNIQSLIQKVVKPQSSNIYNEDFVYCKGYPNRIVFVAYRRDNLHLWDRVNTSLNINSNHLTLISIKQALSYLRNFGLIKATIYSDYTFDDLKKLAGIREFNNPDRYQAVRILEALDDFQITFKTECPYKEIIERANDLGNKDTLIL